jgi:hypothetical protein
MKNLLLSALLVLLTTFAYGQTLNVKGAAGSAGIFNEVTPGVYTGEINSIFDVYNSGYNGTDVEVGDKFIDGRANMFTVTSIPSKGRTVLTVILSQDDTTTAFRVPQGAGVLYDFQKPGYIPVFPASPGRISEFLQARIIIHNTAIDVENRGGQIYQIATIADTSTLSMPGMPPLEPDIALVDSTIILFRDGNEWVPFDLNNADCHCTQFFNGSEPPSDTLGNTGDYFFQVDSLGGVFLWGPKCDCIEDPWSLPVPLKGAQGPQGPQGPTGRGLNLVGSVPEVDSLDLTYDGEVGDVFITTDNNYLYFWSQNNEWVLLGNIQGPQGPPGNDGTDGINGATIRTASGVPSDALGLDGDLYVNTDNGDYYLRVGEAYVLQGNLTGPQGTQGIQGVPGDPGPQGVPGNDGADGTNGTDGVDGTVWRDGSGVPSNGVGVDGDYYIDNDNGDYYQRIGGVYVLQGNLTGPQGIAGNDGADGAPGSIWRDGTGVPSNGLGIDGDYYIDNSNGDYYERVGGVYTLLGNLTGPQGDQGPQGLTGDTGPQGIQGDPGPQGIQGEPGTNGTDGADGLNGTDGATIRVNSGVPSVMG